MSSSASVMRHLLLGHGPAPAPAPARRNQPPHRCLPATTDTSSTVRAEPGRTAETPCATLAATTLGVGVSAFKHPCGRPGGGLGTAGGQPREVAHSLWTTLWASLRLPLLTTC